MLTPPLKWHGGKSYLATEIVALMPAHTHYVEPYAGGLSVLLAKNPVGYSEVVNDINMDLCCFWNVLRDDLTFAPFKRMVEATPFCEDVWKACAAELETRQWDDVGRFPALDVRRAFDFFVCCRQSLAGRMKAFAPLSKTRTRRKMNEQASAWLTCIEGLADVHERLKRVVVRNRRAPEVIQSEDNENTLFYADPTYLSETRTAKEIYRFEMSNADHLELLSLLKTVRGKVMLSGYHSLMYDDMLGSWRCHEFNLPNNAAGGDSKRRMIECLWCNF